MVELILFAVVHDYMYTCSHVCGCLCKMDSTTCTVSDIIKFTYYHCTSIAYSVHCWWSTLYFECTTQYYTLVLSYHIQM